MPRGKLVILNGGSSAGKTSLGRAMQDLLPECYMLLGIDTFWLALPPEQLNLSHVRPEYYSWRSKTGPDARPGDVRPLPGHSRISGRRPHVIADGVVWKREWLVDMVHLFEGYDVTFVGVRVSDAEGARREIQRGDRHAGWNRGSARAAHADAIYDLEVDTTSTPPNILAGQLVAQMRASPPPTAFARLRKRLQ
jgi:chloramphenicol 3-O phosphotransferase